MICTGRTFLLEPMLIPSYQNCWRHLKQILYVVFINGVMVLGNKIRKMQWSIVIGGIDDGIIQKKRGGVILTDNEFLNKYYKF
jgi:hypothetical protein